MNSLELKEIIRKDISNKKNKYQGRFYYSYQPDQQEPKIILVGDEIKEKKEESSIYINYYKQIVNQKIDYILTVPPTYDQTIDKVIPLPSILSEMLLNSSLDSASWLNLAIVNNSIQYTIVNDKEIIPIYDNFNNLISLIRYFKIDDNKIQIQLWDNNSVSTYVMNNIDITLQSQEAHYYEEEIDQLSNNVINTNPRSYGFIPFIPLYNNKDKVSDIHDILSIVKTYNSITQGFVDNLNEFQEALLLLKGFSSDPNDLREAMKMIKEIKSVGIPENGDISKLEIEIPTAPREMLLNLLKTAMFQIGRAVDIESFVSANNITNVMILAKYSNLDAKTADTIRCINVFYNTLTKYINILTSYNIDNTITFTKSQIFNISSQLTDCINAIPLYQAKLISRQTLMKNIPFITDVDEEIQLIEKENKGVNNEGNIPN